MRVRVYARTREENGPGRGSFIVLSVYRLGSARLDRLQGVCKGLESAMLAVCRRRGLHRAGIRPEDDGRVRRGHLLGLMPLGKTEKPVGRYATSC